MKNLANGQTVALVKNILEKTPYTRDKSGREQKGFFWNHITRQFYPALELLKHELAGQEVCGDFGKRACGNCPQCLLVDTLEKAVDEKAIGAVYRKGKAPIYFRIADFTPRENGRYQANDLTKEIIAGI